MSTKKSSMLGLPTQMLIGLVLGVVVGAFVSAELAQTWFRPLGDLFIRLIRMVVVPPSLCNASCGCRRYFRCQ